MLMKHVFIVVYYIILMCYQTLYAKRS
jgi:hypothetical protein